MPWKETVPVQEKMAFIVAACAEDDDRDMSELCRAFGISRNTGYETLERFRQAGLSGLEPRSRAPLHHPNATADHIVDVLVQARESHPRWGPRKLIAYLERTQPEVELPAPSTVGSILKARGLVQRRKLRRRTPPFEQPFSEAKRPNDLWCADFKGWFRTQDGQRCDPLTLTDGCTRFLLCCEALTHPDLEQTRRCFERAFVEYGLPWAIRTDNGTPFASTGVGGLTRLSAWWVTLGITPERIEPGRANRGTEAVNPPGRLHDATRSAPTSILTGGWHNMA